MIPIYVNIKQIGEALSLTEKCSKNVLSRYRKQYREEGRILLDKYTIPTMYLIKKISEDTETPSAILIEQFKMTNE